MIRLGFIRRLGRDTKGVSIVEFGLLAIPLCLTIMGITDLGYRAYVGSIVQGALHEAARMATVGDKTGAEIDAHVNKRLKEFSKRATVKINKKSYHEFSNVAKPEKTTQDTAPIGTYNKGDCFEDANNNYAYDTDRGKDGLGNADDVVLYEVEMTFPRIIPMHGFGLGWSANEVIKASTVLRNQPFAARSTAVKVLKETTGGAVPCT